VLKPELEAAKAEIKDLAVDEDDLILYTLFPVTGKKYLQRKYGKEAVPESMKAITLDDVKRQADIVKKAKAGELVEGKLNGEFPEKTECLRTFNVFVDDECFEVGVDEVGGAPVIAYAQPMPQAAAVPGQPVPLQGTKVPPPPPASAAAAPAPKAAPAPAPKAAAPAAKAAAATGAGTPVSAPMPGMIIKYEKNVGDAVKKGDTVVVLEAMKMENALPAPVDGEVTAVNFGSGDSVSKGEVLAVIG
jgi:oxaloacetate decarboxylase alpha subunit/pyruvate carboxylase subunit B